jgi:CRISPR-associated protein Csm3
MVKSLIGYSILRGIIRCETALRIGGSRETLEIGGLDNPVIKHPITMMPYIPGSSLKGKMRSLMELKYGKVGKGGHPYGGKKEDGTEDTLCPISRVFGPHKNPSHNFGPTRILVRDARLTRSWEELFRKRREELGNSFLEQKQETSIHRETGIAHQHGTLRTNERVPAGTEFEFEIVIRNFDWYSNESEENLKVVTEAMLLLEKDYLGGSGSRGYGKIVFDNITLNGEPYALH